MAAGVTVGFAPAPSGQATGLVAGGPKPAADNPLGLFDALLSLVSANAAEGSQFIPVPPADQQAALGALFAQLPTATATLTPTAVLPTTTEELPADIAGLLGDLLNALSAAAPAVEAETPIAPPLEQKISDALAALAKALGIALPDDPATADQPVAAAVAAAAAPVAILDPLAAIGAGANVATPTSDKLGDAVSTTGSTSVIATGPDAELPAPTIATSAPTTTDSDLAESSEAKPELPQVVAKLAEKLAELARALAPRSPAIADKLAAIAGKIESGAVSVEALAKLGLPTDADAPEAEIDAAIARLLAPMTDAKPAPPPAPFATASLTLPDVMALTKPKTTAPADTKPPALSSARPAAPDEPEQETPAAQPRAVDRPAPQDNANPHKPVTNATFQAALGTDAGTQPAPTTTTAAVPTATVTAVTADTRAMHAAYRTPVQQINIPQVAFEIVRQVQAGASRFQIRLDPPELGRIDVKLDVDAGGNVQARLTVERAETLDLMQRDHRALERALAQAGLDSNKTSLEFSLRQSPFAHDERNFSGNGNGRPFDNAFGGTSEAEGDAPLPAALAYRALASAGGVNIFV